MNDKDKVEVTILGSGTSHGIPMIGCDCPICTSNDPRDKRTRPSIYVRMGELRILVDTAPELRLQCLDHNISAVDAVLFTHHHADHVTGMDDLRRFNWLMKKPTPCYGSQRTLENIKRMYLYAFEAAHDSPHSRPKLQLHEIADQPFTIEQQTIIPIPLIHGKLPVLGFRFGRFAYCTDCSEIPPSSLELLKSLDVLVLDALRISPHPAHFNLEQAVEMSKIIGAKRTYFTHIAHQIMHEPVNKELSEGMALAYDGLTFTIDN